MSFIELNRPESIGNVTQTESGLMSKEDFCKLQNISIPPLSISISTYQCQNSINSGIVYFTSSDEFLKVESFVKVKGDNELYSEIPLKLNSEVYGIRFDLDLDTLNYKLTEAGKLKIKGIMGRDGDIGPKGKKGRDFVLSGPKGRKGPTGNAPVSETSLVSEPVRTVSVGSTGITNIRPNVISDDEYDIVVTKQPIGDIDSAAKSVEISEGRSQWATVIDGPGEKKTPYYVDMGPILLELKLRATQTAKSIAKGHEDAVKFWINKMSDLFDAQKSALSCALERCESRKKNDDVRRHWEMTAATAKPEYEAIMKFRPEATMVRPGTGILKELYPDEPLCGSSAPIRQQQPQRPPSPDLWLDPIINLPYRPNRPSVQSLLTNSDNNFIANTLSVSRQILPDCDPIDEPEPPIGPEPPISPEPPTGPEPPVPPPTGDNSLIPNYGGVNRDVIVKPTSDLNLTVAAYEESQMDMAVLRVVYYATSDDSSKILETLRQINCFIDSLNGYERKFQLPRIFEPFVAKENRHEGLDYVFCGVSIKLVKGDLEIDSGIFNVYEQNALFTVNKFLNDNARTFMDHQVSGNIKDYISNLETDFTEEHTNWVPGPFLLQGTGLRNRFNVLFHIISDVSPLDDATKTNKINHFNDTYLPNMIYKRRETNSPPLGSGTNSQLSYVAVMNSSTFNNRLYDEISRINDDKVCRNSTACPGPAIKGLVSIIGYRTDDIAEKMSKLVFNRYHNNSYMQCLRPVANNRVIDSRPCNPISKSTQSYYNPPKCELTKLNSLLLNSSIEEKYPGSEIFIEPGNVNPDNIELVVLLWNNRRTTQKSDQIVDRFWYQLGESLIARYNIFFKVSEILYNSDAVVSIPMSYNTNLQIEIPNFPVPYVDRKVINLEPDLNFPNMTAALDVASKQFNSNNPTKKIIFMTAGERNYIDDALLYSKAAELKSQGISVITSELPRLMSRFRNTNDPSNAAPVRNDPRLGKQLREIARITNGAYISRDVNIYSGDFVTTNGYSRISTDEDLNAINDTASYSCYYPMADYALRLSGILNRKDRTNEFTTYFRNIGITDKRANVEKTLVIFVIDVTSSMINFLQVFNDLYNELIDSINNYLEQSVDVKIIFSSHDPYDEINKLNVTCPIPGVTQNCTFEDVDWSREKTKEVLNDYVEFLKVRVNGKPSEKAWVNNYRSLSRYNNIMYSSGNLFFDGIPEFYGNFRPPESYKIKSRIKIVLTDKPVDFLGYNIKDLVSLQKSTAGNNGFIPYHIMTDVQTDGKDAGFWPDAENFMRELAIASDSVYVRSGYNDKQLIINNIVNAISKIIRRPSDSVFNPRKLNENGDIVIVDAAVNSRFSTNSVKKEYPAGTYKATILETTAKNSNGYHSRLKIVSKKKMGSIINEFVDRGYFENSEDATNSISNFTIKIEHTGGIMQFFVPLKDHDNVGSIVVEMEKLDTNQN